MLTKNDFKKQIWFDLQNPTKDDIEALVAGENISRVIAEDLFAPSPTQSLKEFGDASYIVLHIPNVTKKIDGKETFEVDIVIGKDLLVTAAYDQVDPLHFLSKELEVGDYLLGESDEGHLFFILMHTIYQYINDELNFLVSKAKDIEKKIFEGNEKEMVLALSIEMRNITNFKQVITPHQKIWEGLLLHNHTDTKFKKRLEDVQNRTELLLSLINNTADVIKDLTNTNNALLSSRQNEIMKTLTVMAFIVLPLSLIASIFGMNTQLPFIPTTSAGFWIIILLMTIIGLSLIYYFKHKKWF